MKIWPPLISTVLSLLLVYLGFAYPAKVAGVFCLLIAAVFALYSCVYFLIIKRKDFSYTNSGKASLGENLGVCIRNGSIGLIFTVLFFYLGVRLLF